MGMDNIARLVGSAFKYGRRIYIGANAYLVGLNSTQLLSLKGPARLQGFHTPSNRYELKWVAGQAGKPGINADIAPAFSGNDAADAAELIVHNITDKHFEILGTNGTSTLCTYYAEGGILLTTDTGATDSMILLPHLDANQTPWTAITWGTDREVEWECDIGTNATITNEVIWAGLKLTNTDVTATDADQVFFRYAPATASGVWQAISSVADTDTTTNSSVTVAASTRYHLKIMIDSSRIARMYINGTLIQTSSALTDAIDLIPYIGVLNSSGAAHAIRIHSQAISRAIA